MQRAAAPSTSSVYVANLPSGTDEALLAEHFGQIGVIKKDKRHGRLKIWIYRDKTSNEPKGDATVTYEDPHAAAAAVEWFDNKDFHGNTIRVSIAESRGRDAAEPPLSIAAEPIVLEAVEDPTPEAAAASAPDGARGRGRGDAKCWQQEGDWPCPNPSCGNINFAFRGSCNRCGASRPSSGSGGSGGGRGRGRGGDTAARGGRGSIFGPNDWSCPMCGNTNWAKRTKCNICNTTKPGHTEGGVREGRAGGYKEFDEAEIEETKRRRKELEEDDGEMYDEFGNLKKKFRLKAKQDHTGPSSGSVGWDKEDLGYIDIQKNRVEYEHNGSRNVDEEGRCDKEREREKRDHGVRERRAR